MAADTVWVIVAALLVMFMQAGFAMLEVGFTRMKNVGTVVAKVIVNLSISSIVYWICGFAFAFGAATGFTNSLIGVTGFAPSFHPGSTDGAARAGGVDGTGGRQVLLRVRLLRRLAGDRVGDDARAHQVHRLHPVRGAVRRLHLPA